MKIEKLWTAPTLRLIVIAATSVGGFVSATSYGQTAKSVVPLSAEANHHLRFENGKVRVYELTLPKGKSSLPHEHSADNFTVFLSSSEANNEPINDPNDALPASFPTRPGWVAFSSVASGPYAHRVECTGDTPFRAIGIELLSAPAATAGVAPIERPRPPFNVALKNTRGRAYRVGLDPGESTGIFTRPANTAIIAISSGQISEQIEGKAPTQLKFDLGNFRWSETPETLSLKNEGSSRVELAEVEIY